METNLTSSKSLKQRALSVIPGGVNSPVRAFKAVGGDPLFAARGTGAHLETTDGRSLIDFCLSFGPLMLGHAHPEVVDAVRQAAARGTSFAVTTEAEIELAELLTGAVGAIDKVRLVNSGTEAVMTALRLARGFTGRTKILKFSGCYHGHVDSMLVSAGSGVAGMAEASSAGVTPGEVEDTLVVPYNDFEAVTECIAQNARELAAVIVEPVAANMGLVPSHPCFLEHLRKCTEACGALLIFDEVITGFRLQFGAYSDTCGIRPDLTCLGKVIGGGMPIGAVGGRSDIMDHLAPLGASYQAGTLSGNPVSVASGLATLRRLKEDQPYSRLEQRTGVFVQRLREAAAAADVKLQVPRRGSLFSLFFRESEPVNFAQVQESDTEHFTRLFHALLQAGVYIAPSPFEAGFLSTAHDDTVMESATELWEQAIGSLSRP